MAALIAGERQAEAIRRLGALELSENPPASGRSIAARLLAGKEQLRPDLRSMLVRFIEFGVDEAPSATARKPRKRTHPWTSLRFLATPRA